MPAYEEHKPTHRRGAAQRRVEVPDKPGTYQYVCNPHMLMMKGTLVVK